MDFRLKADRSHLRDYSTHRPTPRTDNDSSLLFAVQPWERWRMDGQMDGHYQVHYLPHFAVPGGGVLPICGVRGCATWQVWFGEKLPYTRVHIWNFLPYKRVPFLVPKVPYKRVLFCWKLKFHPLKMHVLPTSNVKFSESQVNHTFLGMYLVL